MAEFPMIPLYYGSTSMMMKDYVQNWTVTACAVEVFDMISLDK